MEEEKEKQSLDEFKAHSQTEALVRRIITLERFSLHNQWVWKPIEKRIKTDLIKQRGEIPNGYREQG